MWGVRVCTAYVSCRKARLSVSLARRPVRVSQIDKKWRMKPSTSDQKQDDADGHGHEMTQSRFF